MKKLFIYTGIFFGVIILVLIGVFFFAQMPASSPDTAVEYSFIVHNGDSVRSVAQNLKENGIIRSKNAFYYTARLKNYSIRAGSYTVNSSQTIDSLLQLLQEGKNSFIRVTVPEGLTARGIASILEESHIADAQDFMQAVFDTSVLSEFAIPSPSGEGYLFPDTYFLNYGMDARDIVRLFYTNFFAKLQNIEPQLIDPEKIHNAVILASIVEREYRVAEEAPLMASVFLNRLKYDIGLESCATVVYIITEIQKKPHPSIITLDDLKIDSLYNTYKWAGLPPGPISNPGLIALDAAIHPTETDFYYFRLTDPVQGTHYFSKTLSEHADAGRQLYIKK